MPRNRTQELAQTDIHRLYSRLVATEQLNSQSQCVGRTIHGDSMQVLPLLPLASIDLLIADATHNLSKSYNGSTFSKQSQTEYEAWTNAWVELAVPLLNPTASVYACSARRSSGMIQRVLVRHFIIKS